MEWAKILYGRKKKLGALIFTKVLNFDCITKENIKEHNQKWAKIPDHPYIMLIIGGFGSGKPNA